MVRLLLSALFAVFFGGLFFPPGNETAAFLASLATFGAGFAVRPFGALVFGALGDRIGRKRAFMITMVMMGLSTVFVGLLPTYARVGVWAPVLLVTLRLTQGLAVGGEYGGAATYVAEHAPAAHRGYHTDWLQTTGTVGLLLSLLIILACRLAFGDDAFKSWGWRIPFLTSIVLLAVSVYIRLKLEESPVFVKLKADGRASASPIKESFGSWGNLKGVLVVLFGITSGMTVIWYCAQFYALFFLQSTLHVDYKTSYAIFAVGLTLGTPLVVLCGALSDHIGRKPVMIAGLILAALTVIPAFHALANFANPGLSAFSARNPIVIRAEHCTFSLFAAPVSACDKARKFFSRNGLSYTSITGAGRGRRADEYRRRDLDGVRRGHLPKSPRRGGFRAHGRQGESSRCRGSRDLADGAGGAVVRTDGRIHGRDVSGEDPHHVAVGALPSRRRHSGRLPALRRLRIGDLRGQHLRRSLVSGRDHARDGARRVALLAGNETPHDRLKRYVAFCSLAIAR